MWVFSRAWRRNFGREVFQKVIQRLLRCPESLAENLFAVEFEISLLLGAYSSAGPPGVEIQAHTLDDFDGQCIRPDELTAWGETDPALVKEMIGLGAEQQPVVSVGSFRTGFTGGPWLDVTGPKETKVPNTGNPAPLLKTDQAVSKQCLLLANRNQRRPDRA